MYNCNHDVVFNGCRGVVLGLSAQARMRELLKEVLNAMAKRVHTDKRRIFQVMSTRYRELCSPVVHRFLHIVRWCTP